MGCRVEEWTREGVQGSARAGDGGEGALSLDWGLIQVHAVCTAGQLARFSRMSAVLRTEDEEEHVERQRRHLHATGRPRLQMARVAKRSGVGQAEGPDPVLGLRRERSWRNRASWSKQDLFNPAQCG